MRGKFVITRQLVSEFGNAYLAMHRAPWGLPDTYLVLDDFGRIGRAWRETAEQGTDRETVIRNLIAGQYSNPIRIVAFNTAEGWSRDVTVDIADEVRRRYAEMDEVTDSVLQFTEANRR